MRDERLGKLGKVNPDKFGVYLRTITNEGFQYGAAEEQFSIQSIAKVLALVMVVKPLAFVLSLAFADAIFVSLF